MSSDVSGGDAATAAHILVPATSPPHSAVVHLSPLTPSRTLNQSGAASTPGAKKLLQEEPRRPCVPKLFSSFLQTYPRNGFVNPDLAPDS